MSLENWVRRFASQESHDETWCRGLRRAIFIKRLGQLSASAKALPLDAHDWDRILDNVSGTAVWIVWDMSEDMSVTSDMVHAMESLVRTIGELSVPCSMSMRYFWDSTCMRSETLEIDPADGRFRAIIPERNEPLRHTIFDALSRQLASPSKCLQIGALQGLSQLAHPATEQMIASRKGSFADAEVARMAEATARFGLY